MEKYYLPNGSFFICQNEDDCKIKNCPIERTFEHSWTECESILTRKGALFLRPGRRFRS